MNDTEHRTGTVPAGSTDRLESILESMPAGFIAVDREFRLTYLNRHAEVLFEYAREEVLGKSIWEVFPEVRGGDLYRAGVEGMDERGLVELEFYYEPTSEWYEIHAFPVDDGMAVYFTNVTARKRGEEALEAEVERLGRVIEIQQEIAAGEPDLISVMQVVADRACELTGATGAGVQIVDGDESVYRAVSGKTGSYAGLRLKLSASLSGECIRTGEVLTCEDSETDPRVDRDACRRTGVRSIVAVPLLHRAQVVGALTVLSSQPSAFIQRDVRSLRLMAGFVGAAMARASEFEAKQAALAERTQALHALTASEERFRNLFAHAAVGEATVSLDGRYLQVTRRSARSSATRSRSWSGGRSHP